MKKLVYIVGIALLSGALWSCEDTPENPGDFSVASELTLTDQLVALTNSGVAVDLKVAATRDTVYKYEYTINDTLFEYLPNGDSVYVYGADGKPVVNKIDSFYNSLKTAKLIVYEPVVLPSVSDTFRVDIKSNARWTAKQPSVSWFNNYDGTHAGGGDGKFCFSVSRNRTRKRSVVQEIFTSDSMICTLLQIDQVGERDK